MTRYRRVGPYNLQPLKRIRAALLRTLTVADSLPALLPRNSPALVLSEWQAAIVDARKLLDRLEGRACQ